MKIKVESCRNKKVKTLTADIDISKNDFFVILKNCGNDLELLAKNDNLLNVLLEENEFPDDKTIALEHSFADKIVKQDLYIGTFSYGEWKEDGAYYVGGYIFLFGIKNDDKYIYKILHQRYYEDELDKYGSFTFIDGHTNYFTTNMKQKLRKKPMMMPVFSSDIFSLLNNIEEISNIKEIKEVLDKNQD